MSLSLGKRPHKEVTRFTHEDRHAFGMNSAKTERHNELRVMGLPSPTQIEAAAKEAARGVALLEALSPDGSVGPSQAKLHGVLVDGQPAPDVSIPHSFDLPAALTTLRDVGLLGDLKDEIESDPLTQVRTFSGMSQRMP